MSDPLQLPNRVSAPPGGWRYRVPQTGQLFTAVNEFQLLDMLKAHYRANGYPLPANLRQLIEEQICAQHTDYCVESDGRSPLSPSKMAAIAFHLVKDGTARLLRGERQLVDQEVADRRAAVCVMCTENVPREGCSNCNMASIRDLVIRLVGKRGTRSGDALQVCRVCLCENQAKVHLPHATLKKIASKQEWEALPPTCWLKTEEAAL